MGKWTQRKMLVGGKASFFICLGLLATSFTLGMIAGQVFAGKNSAAVLAELHRYLSEYYALDMANGSAGGILFNALLIYFRYPLLALLLGLTVPGVLLLPALSALFGFFLSFAACCFARVFGGSGVLLAAAVLGLRCLVTLPCFFVVAVQAMHGAGRKCGKASYKQAAVLERCLVACVVAAILLAGALAEGILSPILLERALKKISI